jgi:hypothetical protein
LDRCRQDADVAEIAGAVAGRDVHAAAERDGEMGEVAADADALMHGLAGATSWARVGITEPNFRVNEIADRLHTLGAGQLSELRPGEIGELVAIAVAAREQEQQRFVGKVGDRRRPQVGWCLVRLARVPNHEAIGERDEPRRNFDARDPIAEKIEIGTHRQRGIRDDRYSVLGARPAWGASSLERRQSSRRAYSRVWIVESVAFGASRVRASTLPARETYAFRERSNINIEIFRA